jgi:hypothetical protein
MMDDGWMNFSNENKDRGRYYDCSRDVRQVGVEEGENEEEGEEEEECLTPVRQVYENPLDRCIVMRISGIFF